MTELTEALASAAEYIGTGEIEPLLGGMDVRDVIVELGTTVQEELAGVDSPDEEVLETTMQRIALRALLAGIILASEGAEQAQGVMIPVSQEALETVSLTAIRTGTFSFTLVATDEDAPEQD